ncbi:MAG: ABC transporter permease [Candidatus Hodarchaeales archaeon]
MTKLNRLGLPETKYTFGTALGHAWKNIRQRKGRVFVTGAGVVLGISFIISLITYSMLVDHFDPTSNIAREQSYLLFVALLLCVVGVTNSMYMEVGQRSSEIGTYMTLGTLPGHVIKMFLLESFFIGIISGLLGSILGFVFGVGLTLLEFNVDQVIQYLETQLEFFGLLLVAGIVLSSILSILASVIPVYGASKMNPADALRKT